MIIEFEYFWAILLLFILDRICCLHEQFDEEILTLPDPQRSTESLNTDIEDFYNKDPGLKLTFLRLSHLTHITMLLILTYFFNISLWYLMRRKALPRMVQYKLSLTLP